MPVLSLGSRGTYVQFLQSILKKIGYYVGEIDGVFGPNTRDFVYKFQKEYGLAVDGVVGKSTWNKLMPYINGTVGGIVPTDMQYPYWLLQMNIRALQNKYEFLEVSSMGSSVLNKSLYVVRLRKRTKRGVL